LPLFAGIKLTNGSGGDFLCLTPYAKEILHVATEYFFELTFRKHFLSNSKTSPD